MLRAKKISRLFSLALLAWILSLFSCVPEHHKPTPTSYIIDGPQDLYPSFSPDGEYIAYYHFAAISPDPPGYPTGLYIIDKAGGGRHLVIAGDHWSPSWSPNGHWLVFTSNGTIQKCQTNGDSLTTFSGLDSLSSPTFYFPDWSSDGKKILFDEPLSKEMGFFMVFSDFTNPEKIGDRLSGRDPEFSPTNPSLFVYSRGGDDVAVSEIFTFDILGLKEVRLTQNTRDDRGPTWSPNGQKIAWSGSLTLSVMNADGTQSADIGFGNNPSWSVNDQIVYSHANSDYTKEVLYIISPDGTNRRQITF